jgi:hypothetical protein
VQAVVLETARATGLDGPHTGVALCVAGVAWAGGAAVVEGRWRLPLMVAAASGLGAGLLLAAPDRVAFSDCLMIAGALGVAAGVLSRSAPVGHAGAGVATLGLVIHLGTRHITASEPYLTPVAAQLVVAGWQARRTHPVSSWLAYVPAVALLGGTALAERFAGGDGAHALVVGAVAVAALVAGAWRRLAGPLLVGTGLLLALTLHETLSALAGVPTWAWMGSGGVLLLACGLALERSDQSPAEAGRRMVDVLSERFQ